MEGHQLNLHDAYERAGFDAFTSWKIRSGDFKVSHYLCLVIPLHSRRRQRLCHGLCLVLPLSSWLRHCLCLVLPLPSRLRHRPCRVFPPPSRHCPCVSTPTARPSSLPPRRHPSLPADRNHTVRPTTPRLSSLAQQQHTAAVTSLRPAVWAGRDQKGGVGPSAMALWLSIQRIVAWPRRFLPNFAHARRCLAARAVQVRGGLHIPLAGASPGTQTQHTTPRCFV